MNTSTQPAAGAMRAAKAWTSSATLMSLAEHIDAELGLPALIALLRRIEKDYVDQVGEPPPHKDDAEYEHGLIIEIRQALKMVEGEST